MYSVNSDWRLKGRIDDIVEIEGFPMGTTNRVYKISGANIKAISISDKELAHPYVSKIVSSKYHKLIEYLTSVLIDDDDESGETIREALNHTEKFRLEIKNKYRDYLKRKELDMMAKQLLILQKELSERLIQIRENLYNVKEGRRCK